MDLLLIDLLESSKAIGLCPMGKIKSNIRIRAPVLLNFMSFHQLI